MQDSAAQFWSPAIRGLKPYTPGEQPSTEGWTKLNTNEAPYGPSPRALAAITQAVGDDLRLYPDPDGRALKAAIGRHYALAPDHVFLGNGSDEVLGHAFMGLLRQSDPILFPDISYSFYPVYCGLYGVRYASVPLSADFRVQVADYARPNGGIVLPNPNAPTGIALSLAEIEALLQANPRSVVLVDEAYVDFGAQSAASLVPRYPQLLVVHTFSKSRALAGLRAAFALGQPGLIQGLERVKNSFNSYPLDRLALAGAQAAIEDDAYLQQATAQLMHTRSGLVAELARLGFDTLPSAANFVFTRHRQAQGAWLLERLRAERILVRHFALPRIDNHLRITVGTPAQCAQLVAALQRILADGSQGGVHAA